MRGQGTAKDGRCGEINCNDFATDLAYSLDFADDQSLNGFYLRAFPLASRVEFCGDMQNQSSGVDKIIHFSNGKTVTVDEKKRRKDYGDILLELWKNKEQKKPGWLYYSACDYIVYAIPDSNKIYLLPTILLQMAWKKNRAEWESLYKRVLAKNKGYTTENIPIPTEVLLSALRLEMEQHAEDKE